MTFPAAQLDDTGGPPASDMLVVLNCRTPEAASMLVLVEEKRSIWSRKHVLTGVEALAALGSRRVKNRTVSIARVKGGGNRVWEWQEAYVGMNMLMNRVRLESTMTPVVGLPPGLATAQDVLRDAIVMKGPGKTSGFEVQYVYAVRFQAGWLGRSDEVHLIPIYGEDQAQSCVVFSRAGGRSFMV